MSYLNPTRLHFSGQFQANVSTVNNDPGHFHNKGFHSSYQKMQDNAAANGWFNPQGDAAFRLRGCKVTAALLDNQPVGASDGVLQSNVADSGDRVCAKLVDLDCEQQLVSEIWGLQVRLLSASGALLLQGDFEPAAFIDIWSRSIGKGSDANACAMYQSRLVNLSWGDLSASPFLQRLQASAADGSLSIKFNVDGLSMDFKSPDFMCGRIVGTIGPASADEPRHMVRGRQFMAAASSVPSNFFLPAGGINFFAAVVDEASSSLLLDVGNALPTDIPGGQPSNLGDLTLGVYNPASTPPTTPAGLATQLGVIPATGATGYTSPNWYTNTAGVVVLPLDATQLQALQSAPLALVSTGGKSFIAEASAGTFVRADTFVLRLSPGDVGQVEVYATRFGRPLAGAEVAFVADPSQLQPANYLPHGKPPPVATPTTALQFQGTQTTDPDGKLLFQIGTSDPGNPRSFIDGQVYGVRPSLADATSADVVNESNFISILLWSAFSPGSPVTWWGDLQPIFQQYANLYPVMKRFMDLSDYSAVVANRRLLKLAFQLAPADSNSMPVTRDLSPAKRNAILEWLDEPVEGTPPAASPHVLSESHSAPSAGAPAPGAPPGDAASGAKGGKAAALARRVVVQQGTRLTGHATRVGLDARLIAGLGSGQDVQTVLTALQAAVELEHATIPLYLYALYSLDAAKNPEIVDIIQSVVVEEMLHMTLACNVLNALGGTPQIDKPSFVPTYPGALPGGVEGQLVAELAPFSMAQLEAFLTIEQPASPLVFSLAQGGGTITIGEFYDAIAKEIVALGDGAFVKPPRNQVGPDLLEEAVVVSDVKTALEAIQTIVEQGEGTSTSPEEIVGSGFAHYYRFMQIKKGAFLVRQPGTLPPAQQYAYNGAPIPFDSTGVFPVPTNPKAASYAPGTAARMAMDNFNYTYTALLACLHETFNGQTGRLPTAVGLMMSVKGQAKNMAAGIPDPAVVTGPSFEYQATNP